MKLLEWHFNYLAWLFGRSFVSENRNSKTYHLNMHYSLRITLKRETPVRASRFDNVSSSPLRRATRAHFLTRYYPFYRTVPRFSRPRTGIAYTSVYVRAYFCSFLSSSFSFSGGCGGKRGEIERAMRNVQRVHAPIGFGVYVHCRRQFSEVEHYKCTPGEPSRSTKIDLPGRISRARVKCIGSAIVCARSRVCLCTHRFVRRYGQ